MPSIVNRCFFLCIVSDVCKTVKALEIIIKKKKNDQCSRHIRNSFLNYATRKRINEIAKQ